VNFSALFIRRPVMTIVLMTGLVAFGLLAYRLLPVNELPNVDFPTIVVSASLAGASPETMANTVATPLERSFSGVSGIDSIVSSSSTGSTLITLQFSLARDIDAAAQDVQNAIAQTLRRLPPEMHDPPTLRKVNPAESAILYLALSSRTLPMSRLDEYAETRISNRLSMLPGVAQVLVFGSQKHALRIQLDPFALQTRDLALSDVVDAVAKANSNLPVGTLEGARRSYTLSTDGQLTEPSQYDDLVISQRNGAPIHLRDVGSAHAGVENDKQITTYNGQQAIVLAVKRQPGSNTVEVVQAVRKLLPDMQAQAPGDTRFDIINDRAEFVHESINDVTFTLILAVLLVLLVIWMFLHNLSATVITALSLPTSLIGTFAVMYLLGFSLDNLSLMALTLAVGFVVDDAIVVQENIVRYLERGLSHREAALQGSAEIGFTVVSMTVSLVVVFIPILFMGGILGRLFTEFAVTLGIAVSISGLVALSLTPMAASRWLRPQRQPGRLSRLFESLFESSRAGYLRLLRIAVDHWGSTLALSALILLATGWLFGAVPKGFIPSEDIGLIVASSRAPEGVTFAELKDRQEQVARIVRANPHVAGAMSSAGQGSGGTAGSNIGRLIIRLNPRGQRDASAEEVIQQLRKEVRAVHDFDVFFENPPAIRLGGHSSNSNYDYVLQGQDYPTLVQAAGSLKSALEELPGIQDVNSNLEINSPQVDVYINRERAARLGVSVAAIQKTLQDAFGGRQVSTIFGAADTYQVQLQLAPRYQQDINALGAISVRSEQGELVPLAAVADVRRGVGPQAVSHYSQLPAVTLSFNLAPGASLGTVTGQISKTAAGLLPGDVTGQFAGSAEAFQDSLQSLPLLLAFTVVVIYMVLAILYEHFVHPLTILTALPLAGFGALLALLLFNQELNVFSFAGLILLVGLVNKNGIIMIDFALAERRQREVEAAEAIIEACRIRFRPIMMTTLAAILGTLPIALGIGAGAQSRQTLGIAVVGGLVFSQLFTLFVTPVFFVAMEHLAARTSQRRNNPATGSA
jgi:HAE1 family hydrophobic/amphiphilic exporter-1